jgi:hypothetical protein
VFRVRQSFGIVLKFKFFAADENTRCVQEVELILVHATTPQKSRHEKSKYKWKLCTNLYKTGHWIANANSVLVQPAGDVGA